MFYSNLLLTNKKLNQKIKSILKDDKFQEKSELLDTNFKAESQDSMSQDTLLNSNKKKG